MSLNISANNSPYCSDCTRATARRSASRVNRANSMIVSSVMSHSPKSLSHKFLGSFANNLQQGFISFQDFGCVPYARHEVHCGEPQVFRVRTSITASLE